ncbi:FtsH protease activity modulator HflK [Roseibacillus persicicus]|nr:FtsH protease activity modulator HflK [Roseibacillus persicicus]
MRKDDKSGFWDIVKNVVDINPGSASELLSKIARFGFIPVAIILLGIIAIFSSIYTVPANSNAVILRFGKFHGIVDRGLHFKLPFGIDQTYVVPVRRQLKMEFGFGTTGATNEYQFAPRAIQEEEMSMITGDRNAALVEWVVQYRIDDAREYLFEVRNPEMTLRDASESVMREVVGDRTVDEVITIGRQGIEIEALEKLQALADAYGLGFGINQVQLKNINPPRAVQASFNEVNEAQQERDQMVNIAKGEYNKKVPRTSGVADQKIAEAEGQATQRINEATGDAERFLALFEAYQRAPEVTRERLYLERMQEVLPGIKSKIIMDGDASNSPLPLLHLNGESTQLKARQ